MAKVAMGYEFYDSSGTDDDLPQSHHNRIPRGGHLAGNGRSAHGGSVPYTNMYGDTEMEAQIHHLEREAYVSVLLAFKAQADAITWEKESLITELRRELRLSNEEHRGLLGRVNANDTVRRIRKWREGGGPQAGALGTSQAVHDLMSSPTSSASCKKPKIKQSVPSQSFGGPHLQGQAGSGTNHPSSSVGKRGSAIGSKGRKHKSDPVPPGGSFMKPTSFPSTTVSGRDQFSSHTGAVVSNAVAAGTSDPLIGRKVQTRWPDDNNFYEAVITDYDPVEGRHYLVYDKGTLNETWEWVDLSEIPPEDIRWEGENPGIHHPRLYDASGPGMDKSVGHDGGKTRGPTKGRVKRNFPPSHNGTGKKQRSAIKILHTHTLIKEVERIFSAKQPDPLQVEKAKKVLRDHEQALVDAISRLADLSDGENGTKTSVIPFQEVRQTDAKTCGNKGRRG